MKRSLAQWSTAVFAVTMFLGTAAHAYQVTGPVLEVTDSKIVVEKDKERWEIARDKSTKAPAGIKKGDRVTIQYNMTATSIELRDAKGKDKDAKAPAKK